MTTQRFYEIWAPPGGPWSRWVKPVLFAASAGANLDTLPRVTPDVTWLPAADGRTAIVVDLPGAAGVWLGIALAERGYRPVPLYNAVPGPLGLSLVEVWPIVQAMKAGSELLADVRLEYAEPPAFLLDSNRRRGERAPAPGLFDNRSVSFPTDFPSANLLMNRGVGTALLVQTFTGQPEADLAHTLRRWQDAGMLIQLKALAGGPPVDCVVARPAWYRSIWHRMVVLFRLRRNPLGGFGGTLSEPSAG